MAAINDLISQIENAELKERIQKELDKLAKQKKFGLVFEEHLPECTPLYDVPVRRGAKVALKTGQVSDFYVVLKLKGDMAVCLKQGEKEAVELNVKDLVTIAEFGEPIYPCLKPVDSVCNAPDSDLWHTLIEADNYHALQLLEYLYGGKVDCIYIDPPYNTGARDWKYNNNYVDSSDTYRHSKWLSMMEKRLRIAKKLLNPKDSVLIVTIDEKEYLHLGCLLEEMFPEAAIQMISSIINPKGVSALHGFRRSDEYIFFVMVGNSAPMPLSLGNEWSPSAIKSSRKLEDKGFESKEPEWTSMMRRGSHSLRFERPGLYYAIYANPANHKIEYIGNVISAELHNDKEINGLKQILPIRTNGEEGCWQVSPSELKNRIKQGRVRLGKVTSYGYVVNYLPDGEYKKIINGDYIIEGEKDDGSLVAHRVRNEDKWIAPTQWKIASHDASAYGSTLLANIFLGKFFAFPKSLYAEHDTIRFFVANKPNALIVDFFAGSGTTLHAVNLLNAEDGGHRRCILVTNNEVSDDEAKTLKKQGYHPGDEEWERLGIARYVCWPRTVCSIKGHDVNGQPLKGNYLDSDIPMADGFKANAVYFKLGFLDKNAVALGRQFKEMLPTLWMKAGAVGKCPTLEGNEIPKILLLPENKFAILNEESAFPELETALAEHSEIETVYIVTDYEVGYSIMAKNLKVKYTYQLYRDYLDNFRINTRRG
jgi:adenine-specific DNA-methyltransferase